MSYEEADKIMSRFDKWDIKRIKRNFVHRMKHKLFRKERSMRLFTSSRTNLT